MSEAAQIGPIKGFPMTDIRVDIRKASFNNPDFARLTLKMAAYEGFRKGCQEAGPVLLVPIMSLTVTTPNEFLGEIIADLRTRKCQIASIIGEGQDDRRRGERPPHQDVRLLDGHPLPVAGEGLLHHVFLPL